MHQLCGTILSHSHHEWNTTQIENLNLFCIYSFICSFKKHAHTITTNAVKPSIDRDRIDCDSVGFLAHTITTNTVERSIDRDRIDIGSVGF